MVVNKAVAAAAVAVEDAAGVASAPKDENLYDALYYEITMKTIAATMRMIIRRKEAGNSDEKEEVMMMMMMMMIGSYHPTIENFQQQPKGNFQEGT
jgi:hypothetical protein